MTLMEVLLCLNQILRDFANNLEGKSSSDVKTFNFSDLRKFKFGDLKNYFHLICY